MTRPIYERNPPRDISKQKFRDRQLERRPATTGAAVDSPVPWATMDRQTNLAVTNGSTARPFTNATTTQDENETSILDTFVDGSSNVWFRFLERGIYEVQAYVLFTTTFTGNIELFFESSDASAFMGYDLGDSVGDDIVISDTDLQLGLTLRVASVSGMYVCATLPTSPAFAGVRVALGNHSGASRTINAIAASCYRVRPIFVDS